MMTRSIMRRYSTVLIMLCIAARPEQAFADDKADAKAVAVAVVKAIAHGDTDTLKANFAGFGNDKVFAETTLEVFAATKTLHDACAARFGDAAVPPLSDAPERLIERVENSTVVITKDAALVTETGDNAKNKSPIEMKRVDGIWKVSKLGKITPRDVMMFDFENDIAKTMQETAVEVSSGKYQSFDDSQNALTVKTRIITDAQRRRLGLGPSTRAERSPGN